MKKRLLFCLMAGLACGGFFTSCSDDDDPTTDEIVVCPVAQTTYTDASGLVLTYSGQPVLGKQVVFTPDANDGSKATLTISGVLDFSSLTGLMNSREDASAIGVPGVIPGQTTTTLAVDLTVSGDQVSFEGTTEQNGCTIAYKGSASEGSLTLNLDVTIPTNDLTGATWTIGEEAPIHFVWESEKQISIVPGMLEMPIGDIISLALSMPLLGDQTVNGALTQVFHSVTFGIDGNITAEYKKNMTDAEWAESPLNIAQYTANSGSLRLFLNPSMIIANIQNSRLSRATTSDILTNLMPVLLQHLATGIPMTYVQEGSNLSVYLETETALQFVQALAPIFQDEAFVEQIMQMIASNPTLGQFGTMITPVLQQLPEVIAGTTKMEIGVNFQKN